MIIGDYTAQNTGDIGKSQQQQQQQQQQQPQPQPQRQPQPQPQPQQPQQQQQEQEEEGEEEEAQPCDKKMCYKLRYEKSIILCSAPARMRRAHEQHQRSHYFT